MGLLDWLHETFDLRMCGLGCLIPEGSDTKSTEDDVEENSMPIFTMSLDKSKPEAILGKKWSEVRPALVKEGVNYKVVYVNDGAFGINWPPVKKGAWLVALVNNKGVAIIDGVVAA